MEEKEENYDSLLNDACSDTQSNLSYDKNDNEENFNTYDINNDNNQDSYQDSYHPIFNSNIIKYENESRNEDDNEENNDVIEIDRENNVVDMDDIKYFQKFSKLK